MGWPSGGTCTVPGTTGREVCSPAPPGKINGSPLKPQPHAIRLRTELEAARLHRPHRATGPEAAKNLRPVRPWHHADFDHVFLGWRGHRRRQPPLFPVHPRKLAPDREAITRAKRATVHLSHRRARQHPRPAQHAGHLQTTRHCHIKPRPARERRAIELFTRLDQNRPARSQPRRLGSDQRDQCIGGKSQHRADIRALQQGCPGRVTHRQIRHRRRPGIERAPRPHTERRKAPPSQILHGHERARFDYFNVGCRAAALADGRS